MARRPSRTRSLVRTPLRIRSSFDSLQRTASGFLRDRNCLASKSLICLKPSSLRCVGVVKKKKGKKKETPGKRANVTVQLSVKFSQQDLLSRGMSYYNQPLKTQYDRSKYIVTIISRIRVMGSWCISDISRRKGKEYPVLSISRGPPQRKAPVVFSPSHLPLPRPSFRHCGCKRNAAWRCNARGLGMTSRVIPPSPRRGPDEPAARCVSWGRCVKVAQTRHLPSFECGANSWWKVNSMLMWLLGECKNGRQR